MSYLFSDADLLAPLAVSVNPAGSAFPVALVSADPVLPVPVNSIALASSNLTSFPVAPAPADPVLPIPGIFPASATVQIAPAIAAPMTRDPFAFLYALLDLK